MGNIQQPVPTPMVSRPYEATCKSIAQSLPVTATSSYQRSTESQSDVDCFVNTPFSARAANNGCCFSPSNRNAVMQLVTVKQESFWEYGECLGVVDENQKKNEESNSELATAATTTTDESDDKASTENTTSNNIDLTRVARRSKFLEARSQVKIPVYGSIHNHKPFLEPQILDHLLPFILDSTLARCLSVCPHWLRTIYGHLRHRSAPIVESFQQMFCQEGHLQYESCSLNIQPIFTAEVAAVRIDLLIYCKVLAECQHHCTQIGYAFGYSTTPPFVNQPDNRHTESDDSTESTHRSGGPGLDDPLASTRLMQEPLPPPVLATSAIIPPTSSSYSAKPSQTEYQALFRFETIRKGSKRRLWIQRDMCRFHGDELMIGSMSNVPIVCVEDLIEIPVNIANAFGLVDLNTVCWMPLEFISPPYREFGQHCELERPNQLWVGLDQFQQTTNERLQNNDHFGNQWKHIKTEFTGIDVVLSRSEYVATETGEIPNAKRWLGLEACVIPANCPIVCALPRLGLQHDRFSKKQFRQGDMIRLYVSQGGGILH